MQNTLWRGLAAACLAMAMVGTSASARQAGADTPARVTVKATRDPVDKSYRRMIAGIDLFANQQALAPSSELRFQLLPRLPTTQLDGITLRVVGDTVSLPVPVAPDHSFTLERNADALREDAALIASSKTSTLTWRARVRSPGLAPGTRRLGDLRLECLVGVEAGLLSNNDRLFAWLGKLLPMGKTICDQADGNYLFIADRPLYAVTLRDGARSETLPFDMLYAGGRETAQTLPFCDCQVLLDRSFFAPLWDHGWSDDTVLSFEYMDDAPGAGAVSVADDHRSTAQMRAAMGPASVLRFDSGNQMWRYRYPAARQPGKDGKPAYADFVILFGADGMARKARLSEP